MIHNRVVLVVVVGVLSCLSGVMPSEPPVSPWQALNPSLGSPIAGDPSLPQPHDYQEYQDTLPEEEVKPLLTPEEEFLVNNMPFKLPFKMEKKQIAVAMKLLKEAAKPVVKSKMLREAVAYLDEVVADYVDDRDTQIYMTLVLDTMQNFYEGKEATQFDKIMRGFFTDLSGDEQTGRTMDGVWRSTMQYVYDPVRSYFRNYLVDPISNAVNGFAERVGRWMGNDENTKHYVSVRYPDDYAYNWSEAANNYARRFSSLTRQARMGLEVAARMLETEDALHARSKKGCYGACSDDTKPAVPGDTGLQ